tara:strand:- start:101737 stop:102468 length:732 start_codon:yes stop_codon:yes gene_type:complete
MLEASYMITLSANDKELKVFLHKLGDAVLDYQRLQGFLFAIACSPESVKPSEWFELIWLDDEPQFDNKAEAKRFMALLVEDMHVLEQGLEQGQLLPFFCPSSLEQQRQLGLWCEGFLFAHQYLDELWELALMDIDDEAIDDAVTAALNLASAFTDVLVSDQLQFEEGFGAGNSATEPAAQQQLQEAYQWFDEVLAVYADVRGQWRNSTTQHDADQLFLALEPVARGQLCPCGSGEIFAKCCLH